MKKNILLNFNISIINEKSILNHAYEGKDLISQCSELQSFFGTNHEHMKCDTKALHSVLSSAYGKCVHRTSRDKELQYSREVNDMTSFLGRP